MAKVCKFPECSRLVFGGGYCIAHQWKRKDKKPRTIAKRTMKANVKAPDFGFDSQVQLFKHVYFKARKPIKCMISGRFITDCMDGPIEHWIQFFAHILPKGKFTYWRLNPRNIVMLHPEAHRIVDQGSLSDRHDHPDWDWAAWEDAVILAKKEYKKFVKEHNL